MATPLPAEVPFTDIERDMYENEPPGLFPENQDSYLGQVRKVIGDHAQVNILDKINQWWLNLDPRTVDINDISEWEFMLGIPKDNLALSLEQRRAAAVARRVKGPFTRARVESILEAFIAPLLTGDPLSFGTSGIEMVAGGQPLFAGAGIATDRYRVYYDHTGFDYDVWIRSDTTPPLGALTRELDRITPAHMDFTIDNTKANILDYAKQIVSNGATTYWPLAANFNNVALGGVTLNGTGNGGLVAGSGAIIPGNNYGLASADFDGTNDYVALPVSTALKPSAYTWEAWVRPDALPGLSTVIGDADNYLAVDSFGSIWFGTNLDGAVSVMATGDGQVAAGTVYHLAVTYDGAAKRIYKNGVQIGAAPNSGHPVWGANLNIGKRGTATDFWNGLIGAMTHYGFPLSAKEILRDYNTGINVA